LKAPVYRFRLVLLIVLLFSHAQQNPKSLTYRLVQIMGSISVPVEPTFYDYPYGADYMLSGGRLMTGDLSVGWIFSAGEKDFLISWPGDFIQEGGVHTNGSLFLDGLLDSPAPGDHQYAAHGGQYSLSGGLLVSSTESVLGGFIQTGGTNQAQVLELSDGGSYSLATGAVVTSETWLTGYQSEHSFYTTCCCSAALIFDQQSGSYIAGSLSLSNFAQYNFQAGTLAAQDIKVDATSQLFCQNGSISNWGTFTLEGGSFVPGNQSHILGQLQLWAAYGYGCVNTNVVSLDLSGPSGTVLQFRDSSAATWSGPGLQLLGWRPWSASSGSHHIFFGANARGLTAAQLSKVTFVNPSGWPAGNYPARILATGEVIPDAPGPTLSMTSSPNGLVLSWTGNYQLLVATNVLGPYAPIRGAVSPVTNPFSAPQQYFRLSIEGQ